jgi:hypothetical protein
MKALTTAVVTALVALVAFAAPASATHVQCGDTITETTVLDSDVVCAVTGATFYLGVGIGADDVTLWMNGHTIRSDAGFGDGVQAVPTEGEYTNVHVRGGVFEGWGTAVNMTASDSSVQGTSMSTGAGIQILMVGDRNYVYRNVIDGPAENSAISLEGDDVSTWGNVIRNIGFGIFSRGDRQRHVLNTVESCGEFGGTGLGVAEYTNGAVVNRNVVSGCSTGISVALSTPAVTGAFVRLNHTNENTGVGLNVEDDKALVGRNTANGNDTGIQSTFAGTQIQNNAANNNANLGIQAAGGTIDGGGNTATGNGSTPQCENVACGP